MIVLQVVGSYLIFFVMLYGYEKCVQRYDPGLRMPMTDDVREWNQAARRVNKRRKSHLKVVK